MELLNEFRRVVVIPSALEPTTNRRYINEWKKYLDFLKKINAKILPLQQLALELYFTQMLLDKRGASIPMAFSAIKKMYSRLFNTTVEKSERLKELMKGAHNLGPTPKKTTDQTTIRV